MIYIWVEMWDKDTKSKIFRDYDECCADAERRAREYQITERDLQRYEKRNEAYVTVFCYNLDARFDDDCINEILENCETSYIEGQAYDLRSYSKYIHKN